MQAYIDLINRTLTEGIVMPTRNGGRLTIFSHNLTFDLRDGFPLVTVREMYWKNVIHELIWFLDGGTNIEYLQDNDVHIWDANADEDGNVGPIYGYQWRNFNDSGIDQIANSIKLLRGKTHTTRNLVNAWNPAQQWAMKLPPCHVNFQLFDTGTELSMLVQMRSTDVILGLPNNIASYALLLHLYCHLVDRTPAKLHFSLGDTHIYEEHIEKAHRLILRPQFPLSTVTVNRTTPNLRGLKAEDVTLSNYQHGKRMSFPLIA